ncbi:unnamed protein product, partial [Effrenium voratum]
KTLGKAEIGVALDHKVAGIPFASGSTGHLRHVPVAIRIFCCPDPVMETPEPEPPMAIGKSLDDDPATFFGGKLSRPPSVAQALDELTLGWFHLVHLLRMMLAWAIFASTQECTPYMFQGLRHHLQAEESEIATFAAGFPLGCGFGALAASPLLDKLGVGRMRAEGLPSDPRKDNVGKVQPYCERNGMDDVDLGLTQLAMSK